jgi:hypothetical protein
LTHEIRSGLKERDLLPKRTPPAQFTTPSGGPSNSVAIGATISLAK